MLSSLEKYTESSMTIRKTFLNTYKCTLRRYVVSRALCKKEKITCGSKTVQPIRKRIINIISYTTGAVINIMYWERRAKRFEDEGNHCVKNVY